MEIKLLAGLRRLFRCLVPSGSLASGTSCSRAKTSVKDKILIGFSIATATLSSSDGTRTSRYSPGPRGTWGPTFWYNFPRGTKEQIAQINFLLASDIDVLVVVAHDTDMLSGVVKKAKDAKIPVIAYDRLIMGVPIDAYVSFNNKQVGKLFGKTLLEAVPKGNYVIVNGSVHDNNSFEVNSGLHEELDPAINRKDVHVVEELWLDQWSSDEALEKLGKVLERTRDIDAISCANDQIASAAIQLLSEYRLAGKVAVVGQDADIGACQKVVEGTQLMTVYKPIAKLANSAAGVAVALAYGKRVPTELVVDNKSGVMIPFYMQQPLSVFSDNMDTTVIRDGFHSREDVYRNLPERVK